MFAKIVFCQQESQRERAAGLLKACQGLLELFCTGLAKYCTKAGGTTGHTDNGKTISLKWRCLEHQNVEH